MEFRLIAGLYLMIASGVGLFVNGFVIALLWKNNRLFKSAFFKFTKLASQRLKFSPSRARAFFNCIVMLGIFIWPTPITIFNTYFFTHPYMINAFFGQFGGQFAFSMAPLLTFCMTINRFIAVFFPLQFRYYKGNSALIFAILLCCIPPLIIFFYGLIIPNCAYIYVLESLSWLPESQCAIDISMKMIYLVFFISSLSMVINVLTFIKLAREMKKITSDYSSTKYKRNALMLLQSLLQDLMYIFDMVLGIIGIYWQDQLWSLFLINSGLWTTHVALDGFVMFFCNRPKAMSLSPTSTSQRRGNNSSTINIR